MKFSLCYTSRRPNLIESICQLWLKRAATPSEVEIILSLDANDAASISVARGLEKSVTNLKVVIQDRAPFNCVSGWNAAAVASRGQVLIAIADDFIPPKDWDKLLLELEPRSWPNNDCIVHVDDGFVRTIPTLAIVTRARYERLGYLFYSGYESLFCDTELGEHAKLDNAVVDGMSLLFEHAHCDNGKRAKDAVDMKHASPERWAAGERVFNERKAQGFPIDMGSEFAAYFQVTRDDFCLYEVAKRLYDEGVRHFFFCVPTQYWSGADVTLSELMEVDTVANLLEKLPGSVVRRKHFHVNEYRLNPNDTRIDVETRVRNASLNWIRSYKFKHILIVDGDELWRTGLLGLVRDTIREHAVDSVMCCMVPVIGLPGYPIYDAQDKVTIYIGRGAEFHECRSLDGPKAFIGINGVFHFTGTRRTMDEIVRKHLESGHYDDPNYDFDGWLKNVLPNIKPGLKHAHMYRHSDTWPEVRAWSYEEMEHLPASIIKYLGVERIQGDFLRPPHREQSVPTKKQEMPQTKQHPPTRLAARDLFKKK